jgi:hypothetical protein
VRFGDGDRFRGLEDAEQFLEDERKFGAVFLQELKKIFRCLVALSLECEAELVRFLADFGGGARPTILAGGLIADQAALDIEIANLAGGPAKLLEEAGCFAGLLLVGREVGQYVEELKLGFDAASGGAERMDSFLIRMAEADEDRGFEGFRVLAEGLEGMRRLIRSRHGTWMHLLSFSKAGKAATLSGDRRLQAILKAKTNTEILPFNFAQGKMTASHL